MQSAKAQIQLNKNEERRVRLGHQWIFSNEIDTKKTPIKSFAAGEIVEVVDTRKNFLGTGYVNPTTLICVRLFTRDRITSVQGYLQKKITEALELREHFIGGSYYRLVFGESDGLPGLVIDRYNDVFVIQMNTAGMENLKQPILDVIKEMFQPKAIVLDNDNSLRLLEGLELYKDVVFGSLPEAIIVEEHGLKFEVDVMGGQKTGWFYDQRENRALLNQFIKDHNNKSEGVKVLDLFSYVGAWGINAVTAGADSVLCVDQSAAALELVQKNAELNGIKDKVETLEQDVFEWMKSDKFSKQQFDIVVLDPPALIKRRKDAKNGKNAYRQLNEFALKVVKPGGMLITSSCSFHMPADDLRTVLVQGARPLKKSLQIIAEGRQGLDHPVQASMPETSYLKTFYVRVPLS